MDEIQEMAAQKRAAEIAAGHRTWWYLSYASQTAFLGAVILEAYGFVDAVMQSTFLGLSPGGQVMGWALPPEAKLPAEEQRNRLLSRADIEVLWPGTKSIGERRRDDAEGR